MITLNDFNEYRKQLTAHDWYHEFSDDYVVYRAGQKSIDALREKAKQHPMYKELLVSYSNYVFKHKDASVLATHITIIKAKHITPVTQE